MIAALARAPIARLVRTPRALVALGGWCLLALGFALATRARGSTHGADHALLEAYGALVLPLIGYALVGAVVGPRSLRASAAPLASFGASPAAAAAVTAAVAVVACSVLGAALAAGVALLAHGTDDPPRAFDALTSAYAGALGGAAYAALFAMGASFGKRGGGRAVLLVADWLFGAGSAATALVTPRGHLRNLLGGASPMGWSGRASAVALVVLALGCLLVAVRRSRSLVKR
jgi:hypothetical protein